MSDDMAESLRVLGNWFAKQELVKPGAICLTAADRLDALRERIAQLEGALAQIRDYRDEKNEWDGVDVCMPAMRNIARSALAEVKP